MIEPGHGKPSVRKQASLRWGNRNRLERKAPAPRTNPSGDREVLAALDRVHTRWPFYRQRKLKVELDKLGFWVNRKRLRRLMRVSGMDWRTRAILSRKLSNTLDASFCLEVLNEALAAAGTAPEIINTDQGCQFTSEAWIGAVDAIGAKVSAASASPTW